MAFFSRLLSIICIASVVVFSCKKSSAEQAGETPPKKIFAHTSGSQVVDAAGNPLHLQGVAFGNDIWSTTEVPLTHHNEEDFKRMKEMHMNVIRFYMNYKTFENDATPYAYKQSGWDWIDKNIAWAKKYGIYLILNMHAPQGGYQSQGTGDALWNDTENQNRLTALWSEFAKRYKDEPTVLGFGLVNEPVPVASLAQWQQLAQRITNGIRQADTNHIVFAEKPIYIKNSTAENADLNFPLINDRNVVYEFHDYDPIQYTHQLFTWANMGEGGKYPDENIVSYTNGTWYTAIFSNPALPSGNSNWAYYEGQKYTISDPKIKIGLPALCGRNVTGSVYFDDLEIKEYDPQGNLTGTILHMNLNSMDGWNYWSQNNSGSGSLHAQTGNADNSSLAISAATGDCNISNYNQLFIPKQGYAYQVSGWMKGEQVAADAVCQFRIDFITTADPIRSRNKAYLEAGLKKYADWSRQKNVPVYLGEFGAGQPCFQNNKGGLQWVTDMLDICKANNIYFTYHAYHEDSFGLYLGYGTLPAAANLNQPLIDLFKLKLQ